MSSSNGNGWKPRKSEKWVGPSGQEVLTRRPGPEFTLRLGRSPGALGAGKNLPERAEGQTDDEYAQEVLKHISDEEMVGMARELIVAMVESPKLVLNPKPDTEEIGPDDTGVDFWPLYQYGMDKYFNIKAPVKAGDGEVEVSDLKTFPEQPGVSGDSVDGVHIPLREAQSDSPDSGLVHSTGT